MASRGRWRLAVLKRNIIVFGASAGGIAPLQRIAAGLDQDLAASLFVVVHVSPHSPGFLPEFLNNAGPLPAKHATDGERISAGTIYVAPPDRHLLIDTAGLVRTTRGAKENRFRPAIDPL